MAVGMIRKCDQCGKSYDDGKDFHPANCDGGKALEAEKDELIKFNSLSVDERLEFLYNQNKALEKIVGNKKKVKQNKTQAVGCIITSLKE